MVSLSNLIALNEKRGFKRREELQRVSKRTGVSSQCRNGNDSFVVSHPFDKKRRKDGAPNLSNAFLIKSTDC